MTTRSPVPRDLELLRLARPSMGTEVEVLFPSCQRAQIQTAHLALDEVRRLEKLMTVFSEESQVSEVNRDGFDREIAVDPDLFELLSLSLGLAEATRGAFDPTAGALWRCWGFHRRQGRVPAPEELEAARARTGFSALRLNPERRSVRTLIRGMEINLGSIGKGFALDRAARLLQNAEFGTALLHAGHSSFLALGDPGNGGGGWRIGIAHPLNRNLDFVRLKLRDRGMATSGIGEQCFAADGRKYGHVLDPRSGVPAGLHLSTTVIAPSASEADALSTAFFVMDLDEIDRYCGLHAAIAAIVVPVGESGDSLRVHGFGDVERFLVDSE